MENDRSEDSMRDSGFVKDPVTGEWVDSSSLPGGAGDAEGSAKKKKKSKRKQSDAKAQDSTGSADGQGVAESAAEKEAKREAAAKAIAALKSIEEEIENARSYKNKIGRWERRTPFLEAGADAGSDEAKAVEARRKRLLFACAALKEDIMRMLFKLDEVMGGEAVRPERKRLVQYAQKTISEVDRMEEHIKKGDQFGTRNDADTDGEEGDVGARWRPKPAPAPPRRQEPAPAARDQPRRSSGGSNDQGGGWGSNCVVQ